MSDPSTALSLAPLAAFAKPFLVDAALAAIPVLGSLAFRELRRLTGLQVSANAQAQMEAAAATEAGKMVAAADDSIASAEIDAKSPTILAVAEAIIARLPAAAKALGITPQHVADMVAGELGKLQALMPAAAPAPTSPASPSAKT